MPLSFYIVAGVMVVSAIGAMSLRNLVHCALCLALSFISVSALFLQLDAAFVAFAQILVYVGAVAILIVFAILLTRNSETNSEERSSNLWMSLAVTCLLAAVLLSTVIGSSVNAIAGAPAPVKVADVGRALMTSHVLPLELIGLLLTIALLGAVVLALPEKADEQDEIDS